MVREREEVKKKLIYIYGSDRTWLSLGERYFVDVPFKTARAEKRNAFIHFADD